jgi:hypothetical protein
MNNKLLKQRKWVITTKFHKRKNVQKWWSWMRVGPKSKDKFLYTKQKKKNYWKTQREDHEKTEVKTRVYHHKPREP